MKNITELKVVLGSSNINNEESDDNFVAAYEIESVSIHYAYDPTFAVNDIAMVVLKRRITLVPGQIEIIPLSTLR